MKTFMTLACIITVLGLLLVGWTDGSETMWPYTVSFLLVLLYLFIIVEEDI